MAIEMEGGSGPAIRQSASADALETPVPPKRPFQYSLWSLMLLLTLSGPIIAAVSGALGALVQMTAFTVLFLLMCAAFMAGFFLTVSCTVFWLLSWIEDARSARRAPPPEQ